jgi:hypothetical protein
LLEAKIGELIEKLEDVLGLGSVNKMVEVEEEEEEEEEEEDDEDGGVTDEGASQRPMFGSLPRHCQPSQLDQMQNIDLPPTSNDWDRRDCCFEKVFHRR